eukprot:m.1638453 g.1638453  ORF g.1638453 m.1638453 type:complete len:338 (+) comp28031_c0_seq1:221-1234(+)
MESIKVPAVNAWVPLTLLLVHARALYAQSTPGGTCAPATFRNASTGSCDSCDTLCGGLGCTGPGPAMCISCIGPYRKNSTTNVTTCLRECLPIEAETRTRECQPCSSKCYGTCSKPLNASACIGVRKCKWYLAHNGSTCVQYCGVGEFFLTAALLDGRCTTSCPSNARYYNDTGNPYDPLQPTFQPQLCVGACQDLGSDHVYTTEIDPWKCSTLSQVMAHSSDSTAGRDNATNYTSWEIISGVVALLIVVLLLVCIVQCCVRQCCKTDAKGDTMPLETVKMAPNLVTPQYGARTSGSDSVSAPSGDTGNLSDAQGGPTDDETLKQVTNLLTVHTSDL